MNDKKFPTIKVAAIQAELPFLDINASIEYSVALIEEAGKQKADLIVFPESGIPGYPDWYDLKMTRGEGRDMDKLLYLNSISLEDPEMNELQAACRRANINAVIGINETEPGVIGTMHNTHVYITRDGAIAGKHQKYVPTGTERLCQAPGYTGYKNAFKADFGVVSSLICGENSNPLGIFAACTEYPVVHCASWPAQWGPGYPMQYVLRMCTSSLAYTLKAFVVNSVFRISDRYIELVTYDEGCKQYLREEKALCRGATVMDPMGHIIADGDGDPSPLLFADIDLLDTIKPKINQDFAGHYNRPELFISLLERYRRP